MNKKQEDRLKAASAMLTRAEQDKNLRGKNGSFHAVQGRQALLRGIQ